MCPTKQTANQILQGITTDLFLIKEKITDMQYKLLLDKCKLLYERIEKDKSTTLQLYNFPSHHSHTSFPWRIPLS